METRKGHLPDCLTAFMDTCMTGLLGVMTGLPGSMTRLLGAMKGYQ